ncbi:MAG: hypothetical protein HY973_01455 [Candidatus Kerfeldbacteria bacterium]|nr:hypothetical protein [Candidatus Kerfeldbacteria bacterium]
MNKPKLLQIVLALGALYYLIGAIAHWWGLTIWPFYDGRLYTPYHDSVIALAAIILTGLLLIVARDPVKNIDVLKVIIIASFTASLFSVLIIYKVDFTALGAPDKAAQTVVEGILGFVFTSALIWLYPRPTN